MADHIPTWQDLAPSLARPTLLLGNGASIAVCPRFKYSTLYDEACKLASNEIGVQERHLFDLQHTTNFEAVMHSLSIAKYVCSQAGHSADLADRLYENVRLGLIRAVRGVHVQYTELRSNTLLWLASEFRKYSRIFSTNYDLLLYWSILNDPADHQNFRDYFWGGQDLRFDQGDVDERNSQNTFVHYLHGGLHLFSTPQGFEMKRRADQGKLLDQVEEGLARGEQPLIVSEGRSDDKLARIERSAYLKFSLEKLRSSSGVLVVFGQSLADQDRHLVDAILQRPTRDLVIGLHHTTQAKMAARMEDYQEQFPGFNLRFFDASTHPFGHEALSVEPGTVFTYSNLPLP